MDKKEKQLKAATAMLDKICSIYNEAITHDEDTTELTVILLLAVHAVENCGFAVEINQDESGFIKRLAVGC